MCTRISDGATVSSTAGYAAVTVDDSEQMCSFPNKVDSRETHTGFPVNRQPGPNTHRVSGERRMPRRRHTEFPVKQTIYSEDTPGFR